MQVIRVGRGSGSRYGAGGVANFAVWDEEVGAAVAQGEGYYEGDDVLVAVAFGGQAGGVAELDEFGEVAAA